jgi:hypothetical protein
MVSEFNEMSCAEATDAAAELALGALAGRERARALAHLDRCGNCQETVCRLAVISDAMLRLLANSEPPPGFETRVLARTGMTSAGSATRASGARARRGQVTGCAGEGRVVPRRVRDLRKVIAVVACSLAVFAAALGGWGLRRPAQRPEPLLLSASLVSPSGHAVGQVFAYAGGSGWMYVWVDTGSGDGSVTCQLTSKGGGVTTIGKFWLADGHGDWGGPSGVAISAGSGARLVTAWGTVVATAVFTR